MRTWDNPIPDDTDGDSWPGPPRGPRGSRDTTSRQGPSRRLLIGAAGVGLAAPVIRPKRAKTPDGQRHTLIRPRSGRP